MGELTREEVVAHVRLHPGSLTREIAERVGGTVHNVNAHLTRAAQDGTIVQAGDRPGYRWFPAPSKMSPPKPWSIEAANARLQEIRDQRIALDHQNRTLEVRIGHQEIGDGRADDSPPHDHDVIMGFHCGSSGCPRSTNQPPRCCTAGAFGSGAGNVASTAARKRSVLSCGT